MIKKLLLFAGVALSYPAMALECGDPQWGMGSMTVIGIPMYGTSGNNQTNNEDGGSSLITDIFSSCRRYSNQTSKFCQSSAGDCVAGQATVGFDISCSVDGVPINPSGDAAGYHWEMTGQNGMNIAELGALDTIQPDGTGGYVGLFMTWTKLPSTVKPVYGEIPYSCTVVYRRPELIKVSGYTQRTYAGRFWALDYPVYTVTQPEFQTGGTGRMMKMPFKVDVSGMDPRSDLTASWDVSEPCSNWSPVLETADGTRLQPEYNGSGVLNGGTNNFIAEFTPTTSGDFECTGTLQLTLD